MEKRELRGVRIASSRVMSLMLEMRGSRSRLEEELPAEEEERKGDQARP